jgi:uncharacterized protein DUF3570
LRVQLAKWFCALLPAAVLLLLARPGHAQVAELDTSHTIFYEAPKSTHMLVYTPSVDAQATPWQWLTVRAGWEADVVSGASVSTKFGSVYRASHPADVVSTASVHDLRNMAGGEVTLRGDATSLTGGYDYSTEHDYRSNSLHVNARADGFKHNTQFELSYGRNFDQVCDRVQTETDPTRWSALESSTGCFSADATRTTHAINIDTFEGSWAQSWTPIIETQLTYTAQLVDGFQSDPYRSIVLGEAVKAQEHEPNERARQAVTARLAIYLRDLKGALRFSLRGYSDTWALRSGTAEAEFEKTLGDSLRILVRGRFYKQTGAVFWSDDYTGGDPPLGPRGQYWTGDRELSPFWSWLAGVRIVWAVEPEHQRILGLLESFKVIASASLTSFSYDEYTLGGAPVSDARAYVGTLSLVAAF